MTNENSTRAPAAGGEISFDHGRRPRPAGGWGGRAGSPQVTDVACLGRNGRSAFLGAAILQVNCDLIPARLALLVNERGARNVVSVSENAGPRGDRCDP
jgi:hypothetical protein